MATSNSVLPAEQIGRAPMGSWTGADPNSPAPRRSLAPGRPSLRAAFLSAQPRWAGLRPLSQTAGRPERHCHARPARRAGANLNNIVGGMGR
jgi:hypothetical protein